LAEIDGEDGHRPDGEKLGLPVLKRPFPEVGVEKITAPANGLLAMFHLLPVEESPVVQRLNEPRREIGVVRVLSGKRLPDECNEENPPKKRPSPFSFAKVLIRE
jgi:hypothetical protein